MSDRLVHQYYRPPGCCCCCCFFLISCRRVTMSNPPSGTVVPRGPLASLPSWCAGLRVWAGCTLPYTGFCRYYRIEDIKLVVNKNNRWGKLDKKYLSRISKSLLGMGQTQLGKSAHGSMSSGHGKGIRGRVEKPCLVGLEVHSKSFCNFPDQ